MDYEDELKGCQHILLDNEESMQLQVIDGIKNSVGTLVRNRPGLRPFEEQIVVQLCPNNHPNLVQASLKLKILETTNVQSTPYSVRTMLDSMSQAIPEMAFQYTFESAEPWLRQWI